MGDVRDGRIYTEEEIKRMREDLRKMESSPLGFIKMMKVRPTDEQMERKPPRVELDEPCFCGRGKEFGKCCFTGAIEALKQREDD